jgi:TatD DNase family protein
VLVDSHTHVDAPQFAADREAVIAAAFAAGVTRLVDAGGDLASSEAAVALARCYPGQVFAGVGVHPHEATTFSDETPAVLRALAVQPGVVAIGEIGLDYYYMNSPRAAQQEVFVRQLELARELDLPIIVHNRDAHEDLMALLRAHGQGVRGVLHCFSGDLRMAWEGLDLGFFISFAGPLTFRKSALPEVAAQIPLDRVLIETDSPYLSPHPLRGKRNEPRNVVLVAERLAEIRGLPLEEIATRTTANAQALFRFDQEANNE